jgi:hypothetical protein
MECSSIPKDVQIINLHVISYVCEFLHLFSNCNSNLPLQIRELNRENAVAPPPDLSESDGNLPALENGRAGSTDTQV